MTPKTKTMEGIEQRMHETEPESLRHKLLQRAKDFKTSWINLGQILYTVWKDKLYKDWGYATFDAFTKKEIGIRRQTALKLLRSYFFLEKEEPDYLRQKTESTTGVSTIPTYESIDALRLARKKKLLDWSDYAGIKKSILEDGKDALEVKKDLTALIKQREELQPEEAWRKKREAIIRRFISVLKSLSEELKVTKMASSKVIKSADGLIARLENELS